MAKRAVVRISSGSTRIGLHTMRRMIVLNQDGIASRIVPAGMAPIDRSATHHDRQQDGDRVYPQMPAEQHQVHDGVQFTLITSPPRVNAERTISAPRPRRCLPLHGWATQ
jgi:hypothetical protein